ncbi:MAG: hypothetical protein IKQ53_05250, partial [Bacteroidales bacterium]|nr:hypothetical protein [Bacteroidales bacterium]
VQSWSSCCPVVVQSATGQRLDNNWTTTGQRLDNERCWYLFFAMENAGGNVFCTEKIVAYQKKIVPLQIQKPEKNTIRKPTIAN